MALPAGAYWVYKALGLPVPADGHEEDPPYPVSMFEPELELAALMLQTEYPQEMYPCLYNDTTGEWELTKPNDIKLYNAALGMYAASLIVGTNTAAPGVGGPSMVKRKIQDVEYTFKATDASDRGAGWQERAFAFMEALSCVGKGYGGLITGGLLVGVNPNTDGAGHLTDNRGVPYEIGWPLGGASYGGRREILP